jgi:ABC-type phosphate/phosphonate transport system substrate-binding protein
MHKRTTLLAQYLSDTMGIVVVPKVMADFTDFKKRIKSGELDIVLTDPVFYVGVSDVHEAVAVVLKNKKPKLRGIIIARKDNNTISGIDDLKGKTIAYSGAVSAAGFLSQKITLAQHGIDVEKDCTLMSVVDNKQENVIFSVYSGDSDAGFIRRVALNQVVQYIPVSQIRVVTETAPLPNWPLSIKQSLSAQTKQSLRKAVLDLPKDHAVLETFKINGFAPANDQLYDTVREAMGLPLDRDKQPTPSNEE